MVCFVQVVQFFTFQITLFHGDEHVVFAKLHDAFTLLFHDVMQW